MAQIVPTRLKLLRRPAAELDTITPEAAEPALELDTGNVRLADASGDWTYLLLAIPRAGLTAGDHFAWDGTKLVRVPQGAAIAPVDTSALDGLTISDPPTQAQVQAVLTGLLATVETVEVLRARLAAAGVVG